MEEKFELIPVQVLYLCEVCGKGYVEYDGIDLDTIPQTYVHSCPVCNYSMVLEKIYPYTIYEYK